ncbi:hypothetical protein [Riemerella anatipestifer]|uniref:hypothetical protein n=1 Tax=Riemerella anatipestifer TaxID=34085 RepID=UPI00129EFAC3|nr:hypothetical protein [Riemerella anatipestifer]MRM82660.1 hypothetical protein [Riemerella anatipestifer]
MPYNGLRLGEGGAKKDETFYKLEPEQKTIFVFSKLQKNKKRNVFLRLKLQKSSTQGNFTPAFAKPMLAEVIFFQF